MLSRSLSQNAVGGGTRLRSPGSRGKGSSYRVATFRHGSMCTWSHRPEPSSSQRPSEAHASDYQEHLPSVFLADGHPSCRAGDTLQCHDMRWREHSRFHGATVVKPGWLDHIKLCTFENKIFLPFCRCRRENTPGGTGNSPVGSHHCISIANFRT